MKKLSGRMRFFLFSAPFVIVAYIFVQSMIEITNSEAYRVATDYIKSDSTIRKEFGDVEAIDFPIGNLNSPKGESRFTLRVKGTQKTERVEILLKQGDYEVWKVTSLNID